MALLVCNLVFFQGLETFDYLKLTNDRVRGGGRNSKTSNAGREGNVEPSILIRYKLNNRLKVIRFFHL